MKQVRRIKVQLCEISSKVAELEKRTPNKYELKYNIVESYGATMIVYRYIRIPFDWRGYDR